MALDFYDTFTRVVSSGLGVSDSGHTWTTGGTGSTSVDGTDALFSLTAVNAHLRETLSGVSEADIDGTAEFVVQDPPVGDYTSCMLFGRFASSSSYMAGGVELAPDGTSTVRIRDTGTSIASVSGPNWTGETLVKVRFRIVGQSFRVKVWFGDSLEPANWTLSYQYASGPTSGSVGLRLLVGASSTVTFPYVVKVNNVVFTNATTNGFLLYDTFTRSVTDGLGIADSDHTYTLVAGYAAPADVDGSQAVFSTTTANSSSWWKANGITSADFSGQVKGGWTSVPAVTTYFGLLARWTNASNYVRFYVLTASTGVTTAYIAKVVGGATTVLSSTALGTYASGAMWQLKAEIVVDTLRIKAWVDGNPEPSAWTAEVSDSSLPGAGAPGVFVNSGAANVTTYIDDLELRDISPGIEVELDDHTESPGIKITVNNGDVYPLVRVTRQHLTNEFYPSPVRGLDKVSIGANTVTITDYEMALDEDFVYYLETLDADLNVISTSTSEPASVPVPYHRCYIRSIGQPTYSRKVQITDFPSWSNSLRTLQEAKILGRRNPVVIFDVMEGISGTFECTSTLDQNDPAGTGIRDLIINGQPLYFQSVSRYTTIDDFYFVVESIEAVRKESVNSSRVPRFVYQINFKQVDPPPTEGDSSGFFTWQTLLDAGHVDWTSVANTFNTWLDVLNYTNQTPS